MKKLFSIRKLQKMMILLFLVPMLLLQVVQSFYFLRVLSEEMAQNGREILSLHQNALDDDISRIADSISSYWALDYSHSKLLYPQSDFNAYQYSYSVLKEYRSLMSIEPSIGALLLISQANHMVRGTYNDSMISYGEKDGLQAFAQSLTACWNRAGLQSWEPVQIGQRFYLARLFRNQTAGTLCFIPLDQTLQGSASPYDPSENLLFYADGEGLPLTLDPVGKEVTLQPHQEKAYFSGKYFIVQSYSPTSSMYLVFAESSPISLQKINVLSLSVLGASALVVPLLPLFFLLLKRWYLHPMEQMEAALQKIRRGQMDVRFQEDQKVEELQHLSTSFNQMMDHVKQMKIAAYEKELQYRYAQLQYLQLQISPHFFLNILKSLYGMAQGRNYEKIQTAILMISDHVRYIFHDNQDMVPLQTELHHVENYMQMQRYITSQSIAFHMEVEPGLEEAQVPALCLQTFVENSCKYATVPGRGLEISLEVRQLPSEEGGRLDAVIEAARIDGAGELRILIRVVLPMSIPIIATLALLVGLAYWNDWLNGLYYISDDRLFSIQVLLNRMLLDVQFLMSNSDAAKSLQQNEEFVLPSTGIRMAVAVMGALPILVVYPFFQKYFVKGIVIGAVKG